MTTAVQAAKSFPAEPICPPDETARHDARALAHLLLAAGVAWAATRLWRRRRTTAPLRMTNRRP